MAILLFVLDLKLQLAASDYGNFLQNETSPLPVTVIDDKLKNHLVVQFRYLRANAVPDLSTFLDYITWVVICVLYNDKETMNDYI